MSRGEKTQSRLPPRGCLEIGGQVNFGHHANFSAEVFVEKSTFFELNNISGVDLQVPIATCGQVC